MSGFFIPPLGEEGFRKRAARSTQFFWEYPFPSSSPSPPPPPGLQILCTKQSDNKRVAKNNLIAIYYVHCIFYCFPTYILEENGYIFIRRHLMYMILFMNFFGVWFCFLFFSEDTNKTMQHTRFSFAPCKILLHHCFVQIKRRVFEIFTYSKDPDVGTTVHIKQA